jgi:hypothetical protein
MYNMLQNYKLLHWMHFRWKKIAQDPYNHPHSFLKQISKVFTIKTLMPHIMPHRDKVHSCDQGNLL